jgi:hypothetical protein
MPPTQVELSDKAFALKRANNTFEARDILLTRREAAQYLRKSVPTLERWAKLGTGPKYGMAGQLAVYSLANLRAFVSGCDA